MVVMFSIAVVVMFFMLMRMRIEIHMVVHVMAAVGAMLDDYRRCPNFIERKDRHAEDHKKTKAS